MSTARQKHFTLIELLVVISIMSALAAMLFPVLGKARYTAKNTLCMNQVKQMYLGTMNYTGDNDDYYWDNGYGREMPAAIAEEKEYDHRDDMREYFGSDLNVIMKCPLTSDIWFYNGVQTTPQHFQVDIDNYALGGAKEAKSPYSFYNVRDTTAADARSHNWEQERSMARVGESFKMNDHDGDFRVLLSDFVYYNRTGEIYTAHSGRGGGGKEGGNFTNFNLGYSFVGGQVSDANYCLDDGSVKTYWNISVTNVQNGTHARFSYAFSAYTIPIELME